MKSLLVSLLLVGCGSEEAQVPALDTLEIEATPTPTATAVVTPAPTATAVSVVAPLAVKEALLEPVAEATAEPTATPTVFAVVTETPTTAPTPIVTPTPFVPPAFPGVANPDVFLGLGSVVECLPYQASMVNTNTIYWVTAYVSKVTRNATWKRAGLDYSAATQQGNLASIYEVEYPSNEYMLVLINVLDVSSGPLCYVNNN